MLIFTAPVFIYARTNTFAIECYGRQLLGKEADLHRRFPFYVESNIFADECTVTQWQMKSRRRPYVLALSMTHLGQR
jgi:hypothetical protein